MAMFGFVYLWYLRVVLLVEIWLEYHADIVRFAQTRSGFQRWIYRALTLGSQNVSPASRRIDDRVGYVVTVIGIPSAFLLQGYVGFIFGSVKANPWWSTPLMPIVFLFSAMTSGIAAVLVLYMVSMIAASPPTCAASTRLPATSFTRSSSTSRSKCSTLSSALTKPTNPSGHWIFMVHTRLWTSQVVIQIFLGTMAPLCLLATTQLWKLAESARRALYVVASSLTLIGILAMRWNVVVGGQLFSKSFSATPLIKCGSRLAKAFYRLSG